MKVEIWISFTKAVVNLTQDGLVELSVSDRGGAFRVRGKRPEQVYQVKGEGRPGRAGVLIAITINWQKGWGAHETKMSTEGYT